MCWIRDSWRRNTSCWVASLALGQLLVGTVVASVRTEPPVVLRGITHEGQTAINRNDGPTTRELDAKIEVLRQHQEEAAIVAVKMEARIKTMEGIGIYIANLGGPILAALVGVLVTNVIGLFKGMWSKG